MVKNMLQDIYEDTSLTQNIFKEYIEQIVNYQNFNRQAIFCRYYSINKNESIISESDSILDRYQSGIRFDVYDYTPLLQLGQFIDSVQNINDLVGQMFNTNGTVITFTINDPKIDDLLCFPYIPSINNEIKIFRVSNVQTILHTKETSPSIKWFSLEIEYSPMISLDNIYYINRYVYDLSTELNLFYDDYKQKKLDISDLENFFNYLGTHKFNNRYELYYFVDAINGQKIVPLHENKIIYNFLAKKTRFRNLFAQHPRPFGIKKFNNTEINNYFFNIDTKQCIDKYDVIQTWDDFNIPNLIQKIDNWIWDSNKEKFLDDSDEVFLNRYYRIADSLIHVSGPNLEWGHVTVKLTEEN